MELSNKKSEKETPVHLKNMSIMLLMFYYYMQLYVKVEIKK